MANQEQLRILTEEGVEAWNKWREKHLKIIPDLKYADLRRVRVNSANLNGANLSGANLSGIRFVRAKLRGANLSKANLSGTSLIEGNLVGSILNHTNLSEADLTQTYLAGADLTEAVLVETWLKSANLKQAILRKANLTKAYLIEAKLSDADLAEAKLCGANLSKTQALSTNFQKAILTGACIEDWNINSETNFENVICDYIYLKEGQQERRPADPNRNFEPGEFAKLVKQSIHTVDLVFSKGIDWRAFLSSFQDLQVQYGEQNVSIQAIEKKSDGAFVIRLSVPPEADKAEIESKVKQSYETKLQVLEAQYRVQLEAKDDQIAIYRQHNTSLENIVGALAGRPIQNIIDITNTAESTSMSDTFNNDLKGANIANYANKLEGNARQQANQNIYTSEQKQTLAEAAAEIQKLLKQLEQDNPNPTEAQQIEHLNDETTPKFKRKAVAALKAAGDTALDEFLDNSYVKVGKAAIMGWMEG